MFKFRKYLYLLTLISLVVFPVSKISANAPENYSLICKAFYYSSNLSDLAKFEKLVEQLVEQQSDLNKVDCDGVSLFSAAYRTGFFEYIADVRPKRYDGLELLLKYGFNPNKPDLFGNTPLHSAASLGDINVIYLLVEKGANINARNKKGETPLHRAIYYSRTTNSQAINLLLHLGADPNAKNQYNKTPLKYAFDSHSSGIVELLLQHGAISSEETLKYARSESSRSMFPQIAILLKKYQQLRAEKVQQGVDPIELSFNPPAPPKMQLLPALKNSLLFKAINRNNINEVKKLISLGKDVNAYDTRGNTALNEAILRGREEIALLLIEAGADVNLQNYTGRHPLSYAARNHRITKMLLDNNAIVDKVTLPGRYTALIESNDLQVSKLLLKHGADINHQSRGNYTSLSLAISQKNLPLVEFLLSKGADTNLLDSNYLTPLFSAIQSNQLKMVKLLLNYVSKEQRDKAYDLSILNSNLELEDILSKAGADHFDKELLFEQAVKQNKEVAVTRLLKDGMATYSQTIPSLVYAVESSERASDLVATLLRYGADVDNTNSRGETALYKAISEPLKYGYGNFLIQQKQPKPEPYTNDSLKTIGLLLEAGANTEVATENGSIEDSILKLKRDRRKYIVDFGNQVDLLLQKYK